MKIPIEKVLTGDGLPVKIPTQLKGVLTSTVKELEPLYKIFKLNKPTILFMDLGDDACACYICGTAPKPLILLDCQSYLNLVHKMIQADGIKTSLVHELCHAYLDPVDDYDDDEVEELAWLYCDGIMTPQQVLHSLNNLI
jgi:hypothetical protein